MADFTINRPPNFKALRRLIGGECNLPHFDVLYKLPGAGEPLPLMSEMAYKKIRTQEDVLLLVKDADISLDEYFKNYFDDSTTTTTRTTTTSSRGGTTTTTVR
jgi:hypothetical protein